MYRARRQLMCDAPGVRLTDLLAAREDEAIMEAVSGAGARRHTRTSINKARLSRIFYRKRDSDFSISPIKSLPTLGTIFGYS